MSFIQSNRLPEPSDVDAMADWAFAPEQRELWKRVSRPGRMADRRWNDDRLKALQGAVEQRAVWLYQRFHDDLGYEAWTSMPKDNKSSE